MEPTGIEQYSKFIKQYGKGIKYSEIDTAKIDDYDRFWMIPEVIEFLAAEGVSSYINGYLWTLDPTEYVEWLNALLDGQLSFDYRAIPFARTIFGDVFFVREKTIYVLNTSQGIIDLVTDQFDFFINRYLTDEWFLESFANGDLRNQLSPFEHGPEECLGFNPILSKGGKRSIENLEKVNLKAYWNSILESEIEIQFYPH